MADCKYISCFSYKGGAGRSTLAINVTSFLAEMLGATEERPFVLVDMDIDSCGLTYLFNLHKDERIVQDSVQRWFNPKNPNMPQVDEEEEEDIESALDHSMLKYLFPVGDYFGFKPRAILCLPANPGDTMGSDSNFDAAQSSSVNFFKKMCKSFTCGVLFDSAVGNQLTANWSNSCAGYILCCMRPTKQFREGTNRFFDVYDTKAHGKKIIVVPNVVPTDPLSLADEAGKVHQYPSFAKECIRQDFLDNATRKNNTYFLDLLEGDKFGVPKIDRFMWQEGVLRRASELSDIEHVALDRYREIAAIIANN